MPAAVGKALLSNPGWAPAGPAGVLRGCCRGRTGRGSSACLLLEVTLSLCLLEAIEMLLRFVQDLVTSLSSSTGKLEKSQSLSAHFEAC